MPKIIGANRGMQGGTRDTCVMCGEGISTHIIKNGEMRPVESVTWVWYRTFEGWPSYGPICGDCRTGQKRCLPPNDSLDK